VEKFPKYKIIIRKFFIDNNFIMEKNIKKNITNKDNEVEKENNKTEGPILGKVSNQNTPSFISKIIFSNQKAKGAIPNFRKQNIITNKLEKNLKNQENRRKREKSS
jgi:hypothetical protein